MTPDALIVADDLTGALDTAVPFAMRGRRTVAALGARAIAAALDEGAEVLAVSTATRALGPGEAAEIVAAAGAALGRARPAVVMKKIDSRLKGNVAAETAALARVFGFGRIVVAPAVPDQGRRTVGASVVGTGVAAPVSIAASFAGLTVEVADAETDDDLDRVVARFDWSRTLAVGARGLGAAFARLSGRANAGATFAPARRTLFLIGSRDPITAAQVAALRAAAPAVDVVDAPDGAPLRVPSGLPAVIRAVGDSRDEAAVARRFGAAGAEAILRLAPEVVAMSGGDTALAVLERLGIGHARPAGEAGGGMPFFFAPLAGGRAIRCVLKSGGFGGPGALAALLPGP